MGFVLFLVMVALAACQHVTSTHIIPPTVFGIEFTDDGVVCSASLPNGNTVGLARVKGDDAYVSLMRQYLALCETAATTQVPPLSYEPQVQIPPNIAVQHPKYSWWNWTKLNLLRMLIESYPDSDVQKDYAGGSAVQVLSRVVAEARRKSYDILASRFNVTEREDRPYAMIAWPTFFFTTISQCDPLEEPIPAWQRLDKCDPPASQGFPGELMRNISQAVFTSGFRRTPSSASEYIDANHDALDDVIPAATLATCTTSIGKCYPEYQGGADLVQPNPCTEAGNVAILIDLASDTLSIWAEGLNECFLDRVPWSTFKSLRITKSSFQDMSVWALQVRFEVDRVVHQTWPSRNNSFEVPVILTGSAWQTEAIDHLRHSLSESSWNLSLLQVPQPEYISSMGAAAIARVAEPVFSNQFVDALPGPAQEVDFAAAVEYLHHTEL